ISAGHAVGAAGHDDGRKGPLRQPNAQSAGENRQRAYDHLLLLPFTDEYRLRLSKLRVMSTYQELDDRFSILKAVAVKFADNSRGRRPRPEELTISLTYFRRARGDGHFCINRSANGDYCPSLSLIFRCET